MFKAISQ